MTGLGPDYSPFILFGLVCYLAERIAGVVLRPIENVARQACSTRHLQFLLIDIFALIFLVQIPAVLCAWELWGPALIAAFGVVYCWWRGVVAISAVGIRDCRRRVVFLVFVVPFAVFGPFLFFGSIASAVLFMLDETRFMLLLLAAVCFLPLPIAAYGLMKWVIADLSMRNDKLSAVLAQPPH